MKQIKTTLLLVMYLVTLPSFFYAQNIERIDGKVFSIEKGKKYEIKDNVILVKLKPHKTLRKELEVINNCSFGIKEIAVPTTNSMSDYYSYLKSTGDFEIVEYNYIYTPFLTPNDYYYNSNWYYSPIYAEGAWNLATGTPSIKVAVIDDGVELTHEDISTGNDNYSNLSVSESVDYISSTNHTPNTSHGTMIAGLIAAKTNNTVGIAGIAGGKHSVGAKIISYRTNYSVSQICNAIYDAINNKNVKIINLSLGGGECESFKLALDYANSIGVVVVCSSGNDSLSSISFPASYQTTIAVGASDSYNNRASFSNYGTGLDLVAPGTSIRSTAKNSDGNYKISSGTSFAAPIVAGTIALMLSIDPTLTIPYIKSVLRSTATKVTNYSFNSSGWNNEIGYGLLNSCAAVMTVKYLAISGPSYICSSSTGTYTVNGLPSGFTVTWNWTNGYGPTVPNIQTSGNTCFINNNVSSSYMGTLNAKIYFNGVLMRTLQQRIVTYANFYGTYNGGISFNPNSSPVWVANGSTVTIKSPNLVQKNVSHSQTAPSAWQYNGYSGELTVGYPSGTSTNPIIVSVQNEPYQSTCDNSYQIIIMPTSVLPHHIIQINQNNNDVEIALITQGNEDFSFSDYDKKMVSNINWTIDIYNATTGKKVFNQKTSDVSLSVSTLGWQSGIYIVHAVNGDEKLSGKIIVK